MGDENVEECVREFVRKQVDVTIDRYSDSGGNGELYFGKRTILDDRVALKFYYFSKAKSSHNEPILLKSIEHPNILKIYDAKIINDQYAYFLTPEISGGDLFNHIKNNSIDLNTAISIVQGILKGLTELHKHPNSLVHRDLKLHNILIDVETNTPYISDFGSIKYISDNEKSVVASKLTYIYRPKEAIIGNEYCKQSDIYQVGVILYQVLGGYFPAAPFDWLNEKQQKKYAQLKGGDFEKWGFIESVLDNLILKDQLLNYDLLPPFIETKIKRVIKKATHADLEKRYSTCAEFLKELFELTKGAKNWWTDSSGNMYASKGKAKYYKISKGKKGYELETSKNQKDWRKSTLTNNKLANIIALVNND